MFDVCVAGSLHLDIMIHGADLPQKDETVFGKSWAFKCGGKGGNQAVAAARLGARTRFIGAVGDDDFGMRLMKNLQDAGVDVSLVTVTKAAGSGMSAAIVDDAGDYGAAVVSGANQRIDLAVAARCDARVLLLQNEIPEAVNLAAARAARAAGATIIFNTAPWRPLAAELVDLVNVFVLNRVEAEQSGDRLHGRTRVLTRGGAGLEVLVGETAIHIAAHRVQAISSHGAGDCFCGALAARMAKGDGLEAAARFASAAAALVVSGAALSEAGVRQLIGPGKPEH